MESIKDKLVAILSHPSVQATGIVVTAGLVAYYAINKFIGQKVPEFHFPECSRANGMYSGESNYTQSTVSRSQNWTPIPQSLIDFIQKTEYSVTEVCAGNGDNAELLRQNNVIVHAYDFNSITGKVSYGLNGLVENRHNDNILLICSGFDCERAINNFKGNILIIGGYIQSSGSCENRREFITSLGEPEPFVIEQYAFLYSLNLRPSFSRLLEMGWVYREAFFSTPESGWTVCHAFYVFVRGYNTDTTGAGGVMSNTTSAASSSN